MPTVYYSPENGLQTLLSQAKYFISIMVKSKACKIGYCIIKLPWYTAYRSRKYREGFEMKKIVTQQVLGYNVTDNSISTVVKSVWNDMTVTYTEYIKYRNSEIEYTRFHNREPFYNLIMPGEVIAV